MKKDTETEADRNTERQTKRIMGKAEIPKPQLWFRFSPQLAIACHFVTSVSVSVSLSVCPFITAGYSLKTLILTEIHNGSFKKKCIVI